MFLMFVYRKLLYKGKITMKIKNQVTSLELSKKLRRLGVPQKSIFWWARKFAPGMEPLKQYTLEYGKPEYSEYLSYPQNEIEKHIYSAFTSAELGELLPDYYVSFRNGYKEYGCLPYKECNRRKSQGKWAYTEANARAEMLIYLIENNLLKLLGRHYISWNDVISGWP